MSIRADGDQGLSRRIRNKAGLIPLLIFALLLAGLAQAKSEVAAIVTRVTHLLYPEYLGIFQVKMQEKFQLSDTNIYAAAVEFVADFTIDTLTKKVVSRSEEPNNPAFKIYVVQGKEKKEESWAFFKASVPHFTRQTGLRFEILEFKYKGKVYRKEKEGEGKDSN